MLKKSLLFVICYTVAVLSCFGQKPKAITLYYSPISNSMQKREGVKPLGQGIRYSRQFYSEFALGLTKIKDDQETTLGILFNSFNSQLKGFGDNPAFLDTTFGGQQQNQYGVFYSKYLNVYSDRFIFLVGNTSQVQVSNRKQEFNIYAIHQPNNPANSYTSVRLFKYPSMVVATSRMEGRVLYKVYSKLYFGTSLGVGIQLERIKGDVEQTFVYIGGVPRTFTQNYSSAEINETIFSYPIGGNILCRLYL